MLGRRQLPDYVVKHRVRFDGYRTPSATRLHVGFCDSATTVTWAYPVRSHAKHAVDSLGQLPAAELTTELLRDFMQAQLAIRASPASVNRRIDVVRHALHLAQREGRLASAPHFPHLQERNVRKGFFEKERFEQFVPHLPPYLQDFVRFAYWTGWRSGEIRSLTWSSVDLTRGELTLLDSKNDDRRTIPIAGALKEILGRRRDARAHCRTDGTEAVSEFVFHRDGRPIGDYRRAWRKACELAGFSGTRKGLTFHDLRRTAARNHRNAGVPESVVMSITGHRTTAMFHRYAISDSEDKRRAFEAVAEHLESATTRAKNVVSINRRKG